MISLIKIALILCVLGYAQGHPTPYNNPMYNPDLFEGDIMGIDPKNASRGLYGLDIYIWPNKEIPYIIAGGVFTTAQINAIQTGMNWIMARTGNCVRFVPRTTQANYIRIISGQGCWSYIGCIGGMQDVSLQAGGCTYAGISAHELMHALGFHHEQNRPDRDNYVTINFQNIQSSAAYNFDRRTWNNAGASTAYDFYSIMHYERNAFSINGADTIVPKPPYQGINLVNAAYKNDITNSDAAEIRYLYRC
jgi:hypothetical protein